MIGPLDIPQNIFFFFLFQVDLPMAIDIFYMPNLYEKFSSNYFHTVEYISNIVILWIDTWEFDIPW